MLLRDRAHDRQAEPGPAAARAGGVAAAEAFEGPRDELRRKARACVGYREHRRPGIFRGVQLDRSLPVPEGVVEEIADRLAQARFVGDDAESGRGGHTNAAFAFAGSVGETITDAVEQVANVQRKAPDRHAA